MKKTDQSAGTRPAHQTVASKIQFQSANKSIQIEFTDQKLSPHAGTSACWAFAHGSGWIGLLEKCLPHPLPQSNNSLQPLGKALGFIQGLLCGAKKFTHVAYLRRDPMVPEMVGSPGSFILWLEHWAQIRHVLGPMEDALLHGVFGVD